MSQYVASNPAGVKVDLMHFMKCDLQSPIILVGAIVVGGVVAPFNWQVAAMLSGVGVFVFVFSLYQAREIFAEGDVCPAIVVDPRRQLVAVMTDLSKTGASCPVVKILKQPLRRAVKGEIKKGTRLAFVAMYNGQPMARNWANFGGYLINSGTTRKKAIRRVVESIPDSQWQTLIAAVREMDEPYAPGLYDL